MTKFLWTRRTTFGPSPRSACAMAYDSNRRRIVLFGGDVLSNLLGDTWIWDGSFWTQMDDIGPDQRRDSALVYDTERQVAILFGGRNEQGEVGDSWQWDGAEWTQLSESGPAARFRHAMAFDFTRNRTVLFGGSAAGIVLSDTWEFDGQDWTQREDTGPSARAGHSMTFDSISARVVLFGGEDASAKSLGDTWAWDGTAWVQIAEFGPPARLGAAMVAMSSTLTLFGGLSSTATDPPSHVFADTWEFDGRLWTQRQDIGPGPRRDAALAFDSVRNRVVLFGGVRVPATTQIDITALSGETWELAPPVLAVASLTSSVLNETLGVDITLTIPAPSTGAPVVVTLEAPGTTTQTITAQIQPGSKIGEIGVGIAGLYPPGTVVSITARLGNEPPVSTTVTIP